MINFPHRQEDVNTKWIICSIIWSKVLPFVPAKKKKNRVDDKIWVRKKYVSLYSFVFFMLGYFGYKLENHVVRVAWSFLSCLGLYSIRHSPLYFYLHFLAPIDSDFSHPSSSISSTSSTFLFLSFLHIPLNLPFCHMNWEELR